MLDLYEEPNNSEVPFKKRNKIVRRQKIRDWLHNSMHATVNVLS